ncbi:MAG: SIS domain-containing protein [Alphaproteobacteria bacterium]|nr:SIS domain-containing protein [Alphaproteobacteria bacterium]
MSQSLADYLKESAKVIVEAVDHIPEAKINAAVDLCISALKNGKSILTCGNGGSAADATHIAGELVMRFLKDRKAFRCICLSDNSGTITACANDVDYSAIFERQVEAFGDAGGVLIAISTSGNSPNVVRAVEKAKSMGIKVIGLTGLGGGKLAPHCDVLLDAPSKYTPYIQQVHECLYHYLCGAIEDRMIAG